MNLLIGISLFFPSPANTKTKYINSLGGISGTGLKLGMDPVNFCKVSPKMIVRLAVLEPSSISGMQSETTPAASASPSPDGCFHWSTGSQDHPLAAIPPA